MRKTFDSTAGRYKLATTVVNLYALVDGGQQLFVRVLHGDCCLSSSFLSRSVGCCLSFIFYSEFERGTMVRTYFLGAIKIINSQSP